jgi:hypothetical protein
MLRLTIWIASVRVLGGLSCVGSGSVTERTREIGVRAALEALPRVDLPVWCFSRQGREARTVVPVAG